MTTMIAAFALVAVTTQTAQVNPQAAALNEFSRRLEAYVQLRKELERKIEPLSPTASGTDLQARQQALVAALRHARAGAKKGDLIPVAVQQQIRETVLSDFRARTPEAKKASLVEVPPGVILAINRRYPKDAALPTVPPLLLARLPRLPDNQQYRFFGRHVVILDSDVELVLDYVENALPR